MIIENLKRLNILLLHLELLSGDYTTQLFCGPALMMGNKAESLDPNTGNIYANQSLTMYWPGFNLLKVVFDLRIGIKLESTNWFEVFADTIHPLSKIYNQSATEMKTVLEAGVTYRYSVLFEQGSDLHFKLQISCPGAQTVDHNLAPLGMYFFIYTFKVAS